MIRKTLYNIGAVIRSDFKRVFSSVVGFIIIMGLVLIPGLYSWFNIISNWDPYGANSTKNIKIAVVSDDKGVDMLGLNLNVGDSVVSGLQSNKTIGWQFPDTTDDALEGVYSGKYYAALIVPEDFTDTLMGFIHGKYDKPHIVYYENEKKNIIAPKITSKAKTAVQETVNSTFITTLAEKLTNIGSILGNSGVTVDDVLDGMTNNLNNIESNLQSAIAIMDSMISVTDSVSTVMSSAQSALPSVGNMLTSAQTALGNAQDRLKTGKEDVIYMDDALKNGGAQIKKNLDQLDNTVGSTFYDLNSINKALGISSDTVIIGSQIVGDLTGRTGLTQSEYDALNSLYKGTRLQIISSVNNYDSIVQNSQIGTNLAKAITDLQGTVSNLQTLDSMANGNVTSASRTLSAYNDALQKCRSSLVGTRGDLADLLGIVQSVDDDISDFRNSDNYKQLMDALKLDSGALVKYLSSPVNLETVQLFAIKDYGSAASPFYTILSLWVGALFNIVIIKTEVKPAYDLPKLTRWEAFWGRYFIVFAIGELTAMVTGLGNLFYLGVQCYHPLLYLFALFITDFAITFFNYALVFAFDVAGLAISVILMCIQVGGSGGTYPVEVLPQIFQDLYKYMPFRYGMNALKETIGGMYDHTYVRCLLSLMIYPLISVPLAFGGKLAADPLMKLVKKGMRKAKIMEA
jgi:putative membrane protein